LAVSPVDEEGLRLVVDIEGGMLVGVEVGGDTLGNVLDKSLMVDT